MAYSIPRFLLPRGSFLRPSRIHSHPAAIQPRNAVFRRLNGTARTASTSTPSAKPRTLEQPTRYNPPSHSQRLRRHRQYPGPPVSAEQKERQKTRRYPNMFPSNGSFMHWFLTNRTIHTWLSLSTLATLAFFTLIVSFKKNSTVSNLLPPTSLLFSHPISFLSQWAQVYKLHVAQQSAETAERRRKKVDDIAKRRAYRKAHGLQEDGWAAWGAQSEPVDAVVDGAVVAGSSGVEAGQESDTGGERRMRPIKKWFGIW